MAEIEGLNLTTFEITADGRCFRLNFTDTEGKSSALTLPTECLNQLLMTLPRIASESLRARFRDNSLRLVFPAKDWRVEGSRDGRVILTIATDGGFEASFVFERDSLCTIADTVRDDARATAMRRSVN